MLFHHMIENTNELTEIFSTPMTFQSQVEVWERKLKSIMYTSFPKIRHRKRKFRFDEVGHLIEKRIKLRLDPVTPQNEKEIEEIEEELVLKRKQSMPNW